MFSIVHILYVLGGLGGLGIILGVRWFLQERRQDQLAASGRLYPDDDDDIDYEDEDEYDVESHLIDMHSYFAFLAGTRNYGELPAWHYGYIADCEAADYHEEQEAARRRFRKSCGLAA